MFPATNERIYHIIKYLKQRSNSPSNPFKDDEIGMLHCFHQLLLDYPEKRNMISRCLFVSVNTYNNTTLKLESGEQPSKYLAAPYEYRIDLTLFILGHGGLVYAGSHCWSAPPD